MTSAGLPSAPPLRRYASAKRLRQESGQRLRLPQRLTVSGAAVKYCRVHNPGGGTSGSWSGDDTPYMIEPMDRTMQRGTEAVIFCGSAQGGKTYGLIVGGAVHTVICDPADMMVVLPTEYRAARFSVTDMRRMHERSPEVRRRCLSDKVYSKIYMGMRMDFAWPAIGQLSGVAIPRMMLTDYDRMPEDVDGEGSPFSLAQKRTQTFGSRGITVAESSPGRPVLGKLPRNAGAHEAPPATGILALYNQGDRRRWLWPCPQCVAYFEGSFARLQWPKGLEPDEAGLKAVMICPDCGHPIDPAAKRTLNAEARWAAEGQGVDGYGKLTGEARRSTIGSYWLKGPAAAFQSWRQMVARYLRALEGFKRTGAEEDLKVTVNADQAEPYRSKAQAAGETLEAEALIEAAEPYPVRVAPAGTRFLSAAVDVQKASFKVMVMAWVEGLESFVIDAFTIFQTGEGERARQIAPPQNPGDWDLLVEQVIEKRYPVEGLDGELSIRLTMIDSAGAAGVTARAYDFWRRMKKRGLDKRFMLVKGGSSINAPRLAESHPDSQRKDRKAAARGEIPVGIFNPNLLKDEVDAGLRALLPGDEAPAEDGTPGEETRGVPIHLPRAFAEDENSKAIFEEITAEERRDDGKWIKVGPVNDGFDLLVMNRAAMIRLRAERIDWGKAPAWARLPRENAFYGETGDAPPAAQAVKQRARRVRDKGVR